jgi:hypothetical protein
VAGVAEVVRQFQRHIVVKVKRHPLSGVHGDLCIDQFFVEPIVRQSCHHGLL